MYAKVKNPMKMYINLKIDENYGRIYVILRNPFSTSNQFFPGAGTFLTSLRLFVEKIFFEISQSSI